jgi:transcriptional regulator with XRE-family HTH domain
MLFQRAVSGIWSCMTEKTGMTDRTRLLLARRVRKWKRAKKLKLLELADKAGVGHSTCDKIVNGRANDVQVSTLEKLAGVLDVELWELFDPLDASPQRSVATLVKRSRKRRRVEQPL